MARSGLFITGTDTDVGKTIVTASIATSLRDKGMDIGVFKPMMSGAKREDPNSDVSILKQFADDGNALERINPFQFDEPLAPYIAAKREGRTITLEQVEQAWRNVEPDHDVFLVEGAGGLMVPMGPGYLAADVAKAIGYPLLIVARPGLGTVNHTLLTIRYAESIGLRVAGIILNGMKKDTKGIAEQTNPALIEEFSGVPVIGMLPWMKEIERQTMVTMVERYVSMDRIAAFIET